MSASPGDVPICRCQRPAHVARSRADRRPWTFYVLAALFMLYVLALYGPMICIYVLSFQGPRRPGVPDEGLSLHWFVDLFTQVRTGDVKGASTARSCSRCWSRSSRSWSRSWPAWRSAAASPATRRVLPDDRQPGRARPGARHRHRPAVPVVRPRASWYTSALGAQLSWTLPFGVLVMFAVMSRFNSAWEEAARDLGASRWQTIRLVVIPILAPGLIAVALFGFTLSYDEFARTLLTAGSLNTLPLEIWSMTPNVTSPALYALGTVTTIVSFIIIGACLGAIVLIQKRRGARAADRLRAAGMATGERRYRTGRVCARACGVTNAVDGVNLKIPDGAYCCLLGPSGCGKTTILRMIAGHEDPTAGEILIGGENVVGLPPVERRTAMMFQSYALFPHLTVRDNIAFALRVRGQSKAERYKAADAMIEKVRLTELADRLPAQLSGGQQQRVALARAAITEPRVLLLDEPLSALDEQLRMQMRQELRRMQRELGITFIHVTHTQLEAIALADIVVVMEKGRIKQAGPAREVYAEPRDRYVAEFMGGQNVLSGKVEKVNGDGSVVLSRARCSDIEVPLGAEARVAAGDRIDFAVRRDDIELRRAEAGSRRAGCERRCRAGCRRSNIRASSSR